MGEKTMSSTSSGISRTQLDAVLDAGADAVDDVEIRLHGFSEKPDRRGRVLESVEPDSCG